MKSPVEVGSFRSVIGPRAKPSPVRAYAFSRRFVNPSWIEGVAPDAGNRLVTKLTVP